MTRLGSDLTTHRESGAEIVPMAIWMSERPWLRRRYVIEAGRPLHIPESLDLEAGKFRE
jgi:hypothetical protein